MKFQCEEGASLSRPCDLRHPEDPKRRRRPWGLPAVCPVVSLPPSKPASLHGSPAPHPQGNGMNGLENCLAWSVRAGCPRQRGPGREGAWTSHARPLEQPERSPRVPRCSEDGARPHLSTNTCMSVSLGSTVLDCPRGGRVGRRKTPSAGTGPPGRNGLKLFLGPASIHVLPAPPPPLRRRCTGLVPWPVQWQRPMGQSERLGAPSTPQELTCLLPSSVPTRLSTLDGAHPLQAEHTYLIGWTTKMADGVSPRRIHRCSREAEKPA